jgi:four helix bundle protein
MIKLEEIKAYKLGCDIANYAWGLAVKWDYFAKDTVGKQLVRAVDSIAANIAEGFGRFHYSDKVNFYYFARGSVFESQLWLKRAKDRKLINENDYDYILEQLRILPKEINTLIRINKNSKENQ